MEQSVGEMRSRRGGLWVHTRRRTDLFVFNWREAKSGINGGKIRRLYPLNKDESEG